jgi:hypothetical protein
MQFLWKYIDDIIGKGLELHVILELLFYQALAMVPRAVEEMLHRLEATSQDPAAKRALENPGTPERPARVKKPNTPATGTSHKGKMQITPIKNLRLTPATSSNNASGRPGLWAQFSGVGRCTPLPNGSDRTPLMSIRERHRILEPRHPSYAPTAQDRTVFAPCNNWPTT